MAYHAGRTTILRITASPMHDNLKTSTDLDKFSKSCKEIGFNSYGYGCAESLRKDMPFIESWNHLVFGERFAFNTLVPEVVKEMLPYVDAITIQPPFQSKFPKEKFDGIYKLTGKPILICDFAVRFKDGK